MSIVTYSFLAVLGIVAFQMVLASTSLYGPGMSSDAINYLSTAKHLMEGKGIINHSKRLSLTSTVSAGWQSFYIKLYRRRRNLELTANG